MVACVLDLTRQGNDSLILITMLQVLGKNYLLGNVLQSWINLRSKLTEHNYEFSSWLPAHVGKGFFQSRYLNQFFLMWPLVDSFSFTRPSSFRVCLLLLSRYFLIKDILNIIYLFIFNLNHEKHIKKHIKLMFVFDEKYSDNPILYMIPNKNRRRKKKLWRNGFGSSDSMGVIKSLSCPIEHYSVRGIDLIIIATQNQTPFTISRSKTTLHNFKIQNQYIYIYIHTHTYKNKRNQQKKGSDTHKYCQQMRN